jgi:hypothetical protein
MDPDFVDVASAQRLTSTRGRQALPPNLPADHFGLYYAGINVSDDLFMYFKGRSWAWCLTMYDATVEVTLPNAGAGCDIGPSSIWVKAGASQQQPARRVKRRHAAAQRDAGQQQNDGARPQPR